MARLGSAKRIFDLLAVPGRQSLQRSRSLPYSIQASSAATPTRWPPRCAFPATVHPPNHLKRTLSSAMALPSNPLFTYTEGRYLYNEDRRLAERTCVFNVSELRRLAAESVGQSPDNVSSLKKLAEGGFNRIFLITMIDGFQMVARIPYPVTVPKSFAVASEVATIDFLRSRGLPVPEVFGYSLDPNNPAETEYIFMAFVNGDSLDDLWDTLSKEEIASFLRQYVEIEAKMMEITFPAGGSLYYTQDLEMLLAGSASSPGITLKDDERFCVGPDTSLPLWFGRRSQLDLDRGPYANVEAALIGGAKKELAYLEQFGHPLLPFRRERREAYGYKEQSPWDHAENLRRYLCIAPSLAPGDPALRRFCLRHPDPRPGNFIVHRRPDSKDLRVVAMIDLQHTPILPMDLLAGIPQSLQNHADPFSQSMTPAQPLLPEDFDKLDTSKQSQEWDRYRCRLLHYFYLIYTAEYNEPHHAALAHSMGALRRRLFSHSRYQWEGETLALKDALMDVAANWQTLTEGCLPCPLEFNPDDVRKTMELDAKQRQADRNVEALENLIGFGSEGWVAVEGYVAAKALGEEVKSQILELAETEEERAEIERHWILDDMNEDDYM